MMEHDQAEKVKKLEEEREDVEEKQEIMMGEAQKENVEEKVVINKIKKLWQDRKNVEIWVVVI